MSEEELERKLEKWVMKVVKRDAAIIKALEWSDDYVDHVGDYGGHNQYASDLEGWPKVEKALKEAIDD